jgi:hypothetical protein
VSVIIEVYDEGFLIKNSVRTIAKETIQAICDITEDMISEEVNFIEERKAEKNTTVEDEVKRKKK